MNWRAKKLSAALLFGALIAAESAHADNFLLVANKGDRTLSIINPETGVQLAAVPEDGVTGHEVVASADGRRAFVPIFGNSGVGKPGTDGSLIRVVDLAEGKICGTVDFKCGIRPHCVVIGPKDKLLYVTTELSNCVTVIDPATLKITGTIPTGQAESHMLAISADGKRGYTANVGPGTVSVLDLVEKKTIKIIPVGKTTQRISITPDDKWVFTADQKQPRLAVIDAAKNEVVNWIELPGAGYGTAVTPDGKSLIVCLHKLQQVGLVDLQTLKLAKTVDVPKSPQEVLIPPDGQRAFVSCDASQKIAVIEMKNFTVEKLIAAGKGADGLAWATTTK